MKKNSYTIEKLNQYIMAADRLIDHYANKSIIDNETSKEVAKYRTIKEKLLSQTENVLSDLSI